MLRVYVHRVPKHIGEAKKFSFSRKSVKEEKQKNTQTQWFSFALFSLAGRMFKLSDTLEWGCNFWIFTFCLHSSQMFCISLNEVTSFLTDHACNTCFRKNSKLGIYRGGGHSLEIHSLSSLGYRKLLGFLCCKLWHVVSCLITFACACFCVLLTY